METGGRATLKLQTAPVRRALLSVSEINDKGNLVLFDGDASYLIPSGSPQTEALRLAAARCRTKVPLRRRNGVFQMAVRMEGDTGFPRPGPRGL